MIQANRRRLAQLEHPYLDRGGVPLGHRRKVKRRAVI